MATEDADARLAQCSNTGTLAGGREEEAKEGRERGGKGGRERDGALSITLVKGRRNWVRDRTRPRHRDTGNLNPGGPERQKQLRSFAIELLLRKATTCN